MGWTMELLQTKLPVVLGWLLFFAECQANSATGQIASTGFFATIIGYVVIGVIVLVLCGGISLVAFLVCWCHEKHRKDRVLAHVPTGPLMSPDWSRHLVVEPQFVDKGFGALSDGLERLGLYKVVRTRRGLAFTDGAKWEVALVKGKHLFEIIWPWSCRGSHASVGLGTERAPLKVKGSVSLVGHNPLSWGLDIVRRRVIHDGRVQRGQCPTDGSFVPDRFLMFVDLDAGKVGFGTEVTFWGDVISGLPTDGSAPLYVMVGTDRYRSEVQVYYKGSADPSMAHLSGPNMSSVISPYSLPPAPGPVNPVAGPSVVTVKPPAYTEVEADEPGQQHKTLDAPPEAALYEAPPPYTGPSPPPKY